MVRSFGALAGALLLVLAAAPAGAEPLQLRYRVYGGGFQLLSFQLDLEDETGGYRIASGFETEGLLDRIVGFRLSSEAHGRVVDGRPQPSLYGSVSRFRGKDRRIRVEYGPGGRVEAEVTPPDKDKYVPPTAEQRAHTLDALSAILLVARDLDRGAPCRQTVPVFDGRRRYDLEFIDQGMQELKKSSYSAFAGPAHACRVVQHRIAGFARDNNDQDQTTEARFWSAKLLPGAPPMPVRIELDSSWGYVYVHLAEVKDATGAIRLTRD